MERCVVANFESRRSHCNCEHAGFIVYDEKFEEKVQVIWSGIFWGKVSGTQAGRVVRSFVVLSRII